MNKSTRIKTAAIDTQRKNTDTHSMSKNTVDRLMHKNTVNRAIRNNTIYHPMHKNTVVRAMTFSNDLCVSEVTGQQILDALEWGAHTLPEENGGFLQVFGMTYEIDMSIASTCSTDADGMFAGVTGERRIKNVMVGGEPIDPAKKYTLAGQDYYLKNQGDGMTMFKESDIIRTVMVDNETLMNYIEKTMGGVISEEYADPYGQGRITEAK